MACNLDPQYNCLYGFFECNLPEYTIDVEVTVRNLKGVYNFRKDCTTQSSMCSLWGSQVKPFRSLLKKMDTYMEERQNIMNPFFPNQRYPNRPNLLPFSKKSKTTPTKRSKTGTRRNQKKFCKSRKLDWKYFIPANTAKPTFTKLSCWQQCHPYHKPVLQPQVSMHSH